MTSRGQLAGGISSRNGEPGLVAEQGGAIVTVFAFDVVGQRIKTIWAVRNPEKLRRWTAG